MKTSATSFITGALRALDATHDKSRLTTEGEIVTGVRDGVASTR